ncbi:MAG TPA: sigma-70 family RNA polymerase sigma factor [Phycisphaerae bacterium]|nr:sigma-70 family RNA polymerase sigma factor [Phycisphaerae bacterium]
MIPATAPPPAATNARVDLVYAAAFRQTHDHHLADEITQAVFLILAQKSAHHRAPPEAHMTGWLLNVTRHVVLQSRRAAARRAKHESAAAALRPLSTSAPAPEADILDALDDALLRLAPADREALVRRYLCQLPVREVAAALSLSENAANQRLLRALKKLHAILTRRGISAPAAALTAALASAALLKAPPATAAALAAAPHPVAAALAHHTLRRLALVKTKLAAATFLTASAAAVSVYPFLRSAHIPPAPPSIAIVVTDSSTGKPLPNVHVDAQGIATPFASATTDAAGRASLPTADMSNSVDFTAAAPGYVRTTLSWSRHFPSDSIPAQLSLPLEPAITISGAVVDDAGHPIPHALLLISPRKSYVGDNSPAPARYAAWDCHITADANGHWTFNGVPPGAPSVECCAFDPHFANTGLFFGPALKLPDLKNPITLTLHAGAPLPITVLDPTGKPAANATIALGDAHGAPNATPPTPVAPDGHVSAMLPRDTPTHLFIAAPGATPAYLSVTSVDLDPITVQLHPATTIAGRVLDPAGRPIPHAHIVPRQWKNISIPPIDLITNDAGAFTWKDAPNDPITCDIEAPGFMSLSKALSPGATDVTMHPMPLIRGQVLDAATGKPVDNYYLVPGQSSGDQGIRFNPGDPGFTSRCVHLLPEGRFEFSLTQDVDAAVEVHADDYFPEASSKIHPDGDDHDLIIRLRKGPRITGQLLDSHGHPAAHLPVRLFNDWYESYNGELPDSADWQKVYPHQFSTTDARGRFSFPPQSADFVLLASTDDGFLSARGKNLAPVLHLTPWAKISGHVSIDGRAVPAGTPISGRLSQYPWAGDPEIPIYTHFETTTDANGNFSFDHLFPGDYSFSRGAAPDHSSLGGDTISVSVAPAQSARADLTHSVLIASGQILPPPEVITSSWRGDTFISPDRGPFPAITLPPGIKSLSDSQRREWFNQWKKSPEGRRAQDMFAQKSDEGGDIINPDGLFRATLPPGRHFLSVTFLPPLPDGRIDVEHPTTIGHYAFDLSRPPNATGDAEISVGKLTPAPQGLERVGQLAPDFCFTTIDGQTHTLSDFRGNLVFLYFWGAWCGACTQNMPNIQALQAACANDPRFTLIGLSVEDQPDPALAEIKKFSLDHTLQAILGPRNDAAPVLLYTVHEYPTYFLISPDGHLLATGNQLFPPAPTLIQSTLAKISSSTTSQSTPPAP